MSVRTRDGLRQVRADWIDELPDDWGLAKLRWLAQRYSGGTPDRNRPEFWNDGEIPWLASGAVNQEFITEPTEFITQAALRNSSTRWVPEGALVMALAGQGKTKGMVAQMGMAATCNQSMAAIVPTKKLMPRFLFWWLTSNYQNIRNMAGGDLRDGLNLELIGDILCPIPTIVEQLAVAAFLDREATKIDALVAEQERLIALLAEKRRAVISHAVTKGLDPSAPMKASGVEWLGDVPAHWEVKQLRHFADVLRGKFSHRPRNDPAFYDGKFPFIQTGDITGASRFITEYRQTLNERGIAVSKEFPAGTLVMAIAANIGDVAILDFAAYFPDSVVGLVPRGPSNMGFLFYLMTAMKQPMVMTATVSTQMNLNVDQIIGLSAACPPTAEQAAIAAHLDREIAKLDTLTTEAEHAIALLKERRAALISAAVTGKIHVREAVNAEEVAA
jgi:type I restriction enzyme S subunit